MENKEEKFSYSKIDVFCQCGFKYQLEYIDGHYSFTNSIATEVGTLTHATEESIAKCIRDKQPIDYTSLKLNFIEKMKLIKSKYPKEFMEKDKSDRTYEDKANDYLNFGIYRLEKFMNANPSYEIIGIEQSFKFEYKGKIFKGFIDRVFKDTATNKYIIQDIKTYAVPLEHDKLVTPLQFVVYTLAAKELWGASEEQISCAYDLPFCDVTQPAGTNGYMTRGIDKLDKIFAGITNEEFEPKPTPLCHWCDFCPTNKQATEENKHLCPYFCHWTKDKKDFSVENPWMGKENHKLLLESYYKKFKRESNNGSNNQQSHIKLYNWWNELPSKK